MKQFTFLLLVLSLLSIFMIEEILATREKRTLFSIAKIDIKQLKVPPNDPTIQPSIFCDKTILHCTPTLRPPPSVSIRGDADRVHSAIWQPGTKEKAIVDVLSKRGVTQRLEIAKIYPRTRKSYNLLSNVRSETIGKFRDALTALLQPLPVFLAKELEKSLLRQRPTNENTLVEILCTIPNAAVQSIAVFYGKYFDGKSLENDIKGDDTSDVFRKLMVSIVKGKRDTNPAVDNAKATADAQALKDGATSWKSNSAKLTDILATRTHVQLKQTLIEYKKISGHDIEEDIKKSFSDRERDGMLAVIKSIQDKPKFLAEQLHATLGRKRIKDSDLIRIVVSRSEVDLGDIKAAYQKLYGLSVENEVSRRIGSDYRDTLVNLIKGNQPSSPGQRK